MDKFLDEILVLASQRESLYIKGESSVPDISKKTAEFGMAVLLSSKRMASLKGDDLRGEINSVQNLVDDFRKVLFQKKGEKL